MLSKKIMFAGLALVFVAFSSCTKEGPGGNSTITGKVTVQLFDKGFRVSQGSYPAADKDVFIIYGNGNSVSNHTKTSADGTFQFWYLTRGDYRVFVYSEDPSDPSGSNTVEVPVSIPTNHSEVNAGEIFIKKSLNIDEGQALIKGKVYQVNWAKGFAYIIDTTFAYDEPVYLIYENDETYSDRVRVLDDGTVAFPHHLMGKYRLLVYSQDRSDNGALVPKTVNVEVTQPAQVLDFGSLFIDKKK